ncbi:MAG: FGGY-family carbohydrate kinase [Micropruina sp.]|uniref:FGGY-family carbohydrate kinase n=1 Tax=Micropruina sp. TaxID=2737536 RepID=UPI0039E23FF0
MAKDKRLVIGIDIGTGSSKGVLSRLDGKVIATAEQQHRTSMPKPGHVEHDADQVWWADFLALAADLLHRADGPVVGVTVSGIGPCSLFCDADGRPLRPAILYGVDTRAHQEVAELNQQLGQAALLERCGNVLTSQSQGPKLLWTMRNEPWVWEKARYVFMAQTYIAFKLTGSYVLDHLSASMFDPMYSPQTQDWIPEWCELVAPGLPLPQLRYSNEVAGRITAEAARLTGLPEGIPVGVGTTDAYSEALSVGVKDPGDVMLMYGSTIVAEMIAGRFMAHPNLWAISGLYRGTFALAGGLSASGALTAWLREIAGGVEYAVLTEEAGDVPAGSNGLLALPYFAGERTPISDPKARGVIAGLTLSSTRGELYRALLEATAYGTRHLLAAIEEAGGRGTRYVAVGGGTKGGLWTRIMSDVCGIEQVLPKLAIGASYGDALIAAQTVGEADESTSWMKVSAHVQPDEENRALYDDFFGRYQQLYPATRDIAHFLADHQLGGTAP